MYENEMPVFDLQTDVFDALVPGLMPLVITLGIYYAIKKGKKVSVYHDLLDGEGGFWK